MATENELDIRTALWNENDTESFGNDMFHNLLIEQYKIYVEMADRISARRVLANVFFLTLHTALLGSMGLSLSRGPVVHQFGLLLMTLLGVLVMCYAWWRVVQYYRHLSVAKNLVINELEKRLPCKAIGFAETKALGHDKSYNPLRRMELFMPFIFGLLYIFCFGYVTYLSYAS